MRLSRASGRSPCSTWISTAVWLSAAVLNISLFFVGMVVLRGIRTVMTPPSVSTPSDSGVTSRSTTSLTSPASTPPWMAAPTATTSSGFTPLCGSLPKSCLTSFLHLRHARLPADEHDLVDVLRGDARRPSGPGGRARSVRSMRSATSASSLARVSVITRCLGPLASAVMKGRLISVCTVELSSILAFSAASLRRCSAMRSWRRSMPCSFLNSVGDPVDDALVEVVAAEVRVAVGGLHLEDALADLEDRDVEGAAAEVVDGDLLVRSSCRGRRPARRRWAR